MRCVGRCIALVVVVGLAVSYARAEDANTKLEARSSNGAAPAEDPTSKIEDAGLQIPQRSSPFSAASAFAQPRCVKIYGAGIGREHGYATGIIVSPNGDILTAEGIYLAGDRIRVVTPDGQVHLAVVARRSEALRVALLRINAPTPLYFEVPSEPVAEVGDWVIAVSNVFKVAEGTEALSLNLGVKSMRASLDTRRRAIDFDVAGPIMLIDAITSNPGSPGGAVVTYDGQLAGMTGKLLQSESTGTRLNYAVPSDLLRRFLDGEEIATADDGEDGLPAGKPYLGVRLFRMAGRKAPAYIDRVAMDSPAAKAGLKKDDLVLAIDQTIVRHIEHFDELAAKLRPGRQLMLIIKRGEQVLEVPLTVGAEEEDE
jgi:serine protease Do